MHIAALSNEHLLASLRTVVGDERRLVARVLTYLAEVEERRLHLELAFSSMFDFCIRHLGLSDDQACRRMAVARLGRQHPQLITAIADGRMHLSGVYQLREVFTESNVDDVIDAASGKSRKEIDRLIAKLAPKPNVPDSIRAIPEQVGLAAAAAAAPATAMIPAAISAAAAPSLPLTQQLVPLSEQSYRMTLTLSTAQHDKLERATALMRHRNPSGAIAPVLERALDLLLEALEKELHGAVKRPRRSKGAADPSEVTNATRREVRERDGDQCSFLSATGERCPARDFLEHDHRQPRARGGLGDAANIRILCRAHNQFLAEQEFGREHMDRMRRRARPKTPAPKRTPLPGGSPSEALISDAQRATDTRNEPAACSQRSDAHDPSQSEDAHPRQPGSREAGAVGAARSPHDEGAADPRTELAAGSLPSDSHDPPQSEVAHPRQPGAREAGAGGASRSPHDVVRYGLIGLGFRSKDTDRVLDAMPRDMWHEPLETILRTAIARLT